MVVMMSLSFVMGRLGLELAAMYLEALENDPIADGEDIKACAGICVVKTHYPFARAYPT